ncbi:PAN2-PAN3 deadenylation complex subunit PAN3 isoform X1 [Mirounga angustirostris]|uniref:PAN2-PAN3 deadenylation complex subunit PAN3 isoform X1 n=2 Tax=Phoca vitulina TaxID=9720 RepID=UPI0013964B64|nr:PAN2-PAN3 deadenylation complex subunit PAN3 isoform X1 [Phoca vitulina]XP_034859518.1 PAN2-PAN3 deadenylation complex subunit PAN3 isoform X1 [Mirounga leonina]XP_035932939.1 PAN2-PAN3 deadenylation complex subunit PAN3 isoform X1 [Halichoerus grypus]XP_045725199.1 PAN2-PAN3 deadenylation complex subunit PAN3 isoform X1 [Mirounga angustirostris]
MNSGGGLPPPSAAASPSSSSLAAAVAVVAPPGVGGVPGGAAAGVKLKYCRYYAKDKTCFYGEECQFLHEDPAAGAAPALGLHSNSVPLALAGAPVAAFPPGAVPGGGAGPPPGPKKPDLGGPGAGAAAGGGGSSGVLDGPRLAIPGIDGGALTDTSLTDSYFSTSFIGVNGFGSPVETKYPLMQRMTNSSSSPSLLNDSAKPYAGHDPLTSPASSLFNDFGALNISQRRKPRKYRLGMLEERLVPMGSKARKAKNPIGCLADRCKSGVPINMVWWNRVTENNLQTPNPTASEFIPKGGSTSRLSNVSQSNMSAFSQVFSHPSMGSPAAAGLAPGMSLSAGSSPLHSPKITPHTSPAPRRRSHTPNPANYMVPSSASTPVNNPVSQTPSSGQVIQKETVGGTTYFYTDTTPAPLTGMRSFKNYHRTACRTEGQIIEVFPNYHIYPPTAPHVAYMQPKANAPSFFMADELRQELINRHLITMAQIDQADMPAVPTEVDSYHSLFPLEPLPPPNRIQKSSNFGYITSCYKAVNSKDDLPYCLRRIHGFRLVNTKCMVLVDMWKKIQHSNIVTLREVFTTKAFAEPSLVFAYDFHAGGETMMSRHFNDPNADAYFTKRKWGQHDGPLPRQHAGLLPESLIWAYIVQLSSALRTIHTAGLACRVMDPTKILITGKTRLRVNCVGVFDVLTFDNSQNNNPLALMAQYQQADLISLGKVVLALACNSLAGIQRENLQKAMELVTINYSSDLKNLILYLLTDQNRMRSVNDIMPMIGARFYTQLDAAQMRNDVIEEDLAKEVQNGRLFRLLAKLGTINERPEFQKDPTWSETGDRYLLKLFRDHLFHQVTEAGAPWIDLSHIISCLNKLDAGVPEKISLISRDEKSVLVVTYSDLKRCFENTFQELIAAANGQL